jgi:hypothetical protein
LSLVEIARFDTRVEADLARLLLNDSHIEAVLFDTEMHNYLGVGWLMPVRLMGLEEDAADAQRILTEGGLLPPG